MKSYRIILSVIGAMWPLVGIMSPRNSLLICILSSVAILFLNIISNSIAGFIKQTCSPDTIYYNNTTELIKTKIFWSWGIYVIATILTSFVAVSYLLESKWWVILIIILIAGPIGIILIQSENNNKQ